MTMPEKFVIYTDLDGTLLDHVTYSFHPALEALEQIREKKIPLIICTSKTRPEIEFYRKLLGNKEPFISENGGGIFIPNGYFSRDFEYDKEIKGYKVIELGTQEPVLDQVLKGISGETGIEIRSFRDMSAGEISEHTGLDEYTAELSRVRDYSEPYLVNGDESDAATIARNINLKGYRHTKGGRFHHILGENDKGKAVNILSDMYSREIGEIKTVGLGDSLNDLPMLEAVDIPVLVEKQGGVYERDISLQNLIYADGVGPLGWNSEILKILMNYDDEEANNNRN
jgi:mannosyl-3-phosphoglycerate phosphatase